MTALEIYEKVLLVNPLDERKFISYLNDTIDELESLYGDPAKLVFEEGGKRAVNGIDEAVNVRPLYLPAIVDNILHLATAAEGRKGEFLRKSKGAYLAYWNQNAKGKRMNRRNRY